MVESMAITVIHGEDIITSRLFLKKELGVCKARVLDAKTPDSGTILQELAAVSLFEDDQPLVIEHLLSTKRTSVLTSLAQSTRIVYLWEAQEIASAMLGKLGQARVVHFPISRGLFSFIDSLRPCTFPTMVDGFHKLLILGEAPEFIWRVLMNRLRELTHFKSSEVTTKPQWKMQKLQTQVKTFDRRVLLRVYLRAIETEYALKSGKSALSIISQTELVLAAIDRCSQARYATRSTKHSYSAL